MAAMNNNDRIYLKTNRTVGSEAYYAEAMSYGFYGVEDDGRAFKVISR